MGKEASAPKDSKKPPARGAGTPLGSRINGRNGQVFDLGVPARRGRGGLPGGIGLRLGLGTGLWLGLRIFIGVLHCFYLPVRTAGRGPASLVCAGRGPKSQADPGFYPWYDFPKSGQTMI